MQPRRLQLSGPQLWEVSAPVDVAAFVRELPQLLPSDAGLMLEGGHRLKSAAKLLRQHALREHPLVVEDILFPRQKPFYVKLSVCLELADAFEKHAAGEVCDHLKAFIGERLLLHWHDIVPGHGAMLLSRKIPEKRVAAFCARLSCAYKQIEWKH